MNEQLFYLIEYNDPAIAGHWGRRTAEVAETYHGPTAEADAWAELRRRKAMLRWAGTGCTYYGVSTARPPAPDPRPLPDFDPLYAGESLDEEPGVGYPGGRWALEDY
jgi:hypothetical protein